MKEQAKQHQKWWQKINQHRMWSAIIIVASALVIALLVVIVLAYVFNVNVPGLRGKTLWDWLQLLIIPLALTVIALLYNRATTRIEQKIAADRYEQDQKIAKQRYEHDEEISRRHYHQDQQIAKQRYEQDQKIALDKQHEDLLQAYLDRMSELLLEKGLRTSQADAEVRNVARTRTISVLRQLDPVRVGDVFTFLNEAGLMKTPEPIVRLGDANLSKVNWSEADLTDANLSVANLSGADLSKANLNGAFLIDADLRAVDLTEANLSKANLSGADLLGADLSGADLRDVEGITNEQLKQAQSLEGATMPDGSIHP